MPCARCCQVWRPLSRDVLVCFPLGLPIGMHCPTPGGTCSKCFRKCHESRLRGCNTVYFFAILKKEKPHLPHNFSGPEGAVSHPGAGPSFRSGTHQPGCATHHAGRDRTHVVTVYTDAQKVLLGCVNPARASCVVRSTQPWTNLYAHFC